MSVHLSIRLFFWVLDISIEINHFYHGILGVVILIFFGLSVTNYKIHSWDSALLNDKSRIQGAWSTSSRREVLRCLIACLLCAFDFLFAFWHDHALAWRSQSLLWIGILLESQLLLAQSVIGALGILAAPQVIHHTQLGLVSFCFCKQSHILTPAWLQRRLHHELALGSTVWNTSQLCRWWAGRTCPWLQNLLPA